MDKSKVMAGGALYVLVVVMPTIHLVFHEYAWEQPVFERVMIGATAILAGHLVWEGMRGPRDPMVMAQRPRKYWGIQPVWFVGALAAFYLAWFSNLPNTLAGLSSQSILNVTNQGVEPLIDLWPRVIEVLMTHAGVFLLLRGIKTTKTPEQRRMVKAQRKAKKEARKAPYAAAAQVVRVKGSRKASR